MKKDVFEELVVVKRSGQRVNFNGYKIAVAIKNAFDSIIGEYDEKNINKVYENVLKNIELNYGLRKTINVEDIQDIIENELKKQNYIDVYNEFSEYRKKRAESRQAFTIKQQHKFARAMEKITDDNLLGTENTYTPNEILLEYGNTVLNEFVKSYIVDNKYLRMHEEGNIFINDITNAPLGRVSHTNLLLEDKLKNCKTASEILNYLIESTDEIKGEIHISSIDKILSECTIKKFKNILIEHTKNYLIVSGYENYINNDVITNVIEKSDYLNILDNLNNIALNERIKEIFKQAYEDSKTKIKNIINNDLEYLLLHLNKYKSKFSFSIGPSTSDEQDLLINIIIDILAKNERLNNVSFIYKIKGTEDINLEKIFNLMEANKNILIQNINIDNGKSEYFSNGIKIYDNYNDENSSEGRMIVSETSINIARLGIIYKDQTKKKFYEKLEEILDLVKSELLLMFEMIGNKSKENYKILFDGNILYDEKLESGGKIRKVIKNSNLLIGLVGIKECVELFETDEEKQYKLACDILTFVNNKCKSYREETKINFYTFEPYEDNSRKYFMALDKSIYGIRKGITDKEYYDIITNIKGLKNDYEKVGEITSLLKGGCIYTKEMKDNMTYKKFLVLLNDIIDNKIGIIKFIRSSG